MVDLNILGLALCVVCSLVTGGATFVGIFSDLTLRMSSFPNVVLDRVIAGLGRFSTLCFGTFLDLNDILPNEARMKLDPAEI